MRVHDKGAAMSIEMEQECPDCGQAQTFWKTGSTELHLGTKRKWQCAECGYAFVRINHTVDTSAV